MTSDPNTVNLKRPRSNNEDDQNDLSETTLFQDSCWKCLGHGFKYNKRTKEYNGDSCGVCSGSGKRSQSKKSQSLSQQKGKIIKLRGHPKGLKRGQPAVGNEKEVKVNDGEILASLGCGDWRIFQLTNGHKLTVDDFICAWVAAEEMRVKGFGPSSGPFGKQDGGKFRKVFKHADLGCGCGSVLMTLAWAFPDCIQSSGVEAQAVSFDLCKRGLTFNLGVNGLKPRRDEVWLSHNDFRNWKGGDRAPFDLITGTPPYFPLSRFIASENHSQKVRCRVPTRGAASDYVETAARLLADDGIFVMVESARKEAETAVLEASENYNLKILKVVDIITRSGLPPRFSCWVMSRRHAKSDSEEFQRTSFTLRNSDLKRSLEYQKAMETMGWIDFENIKKDSEGAPNAISPTPAQNT